MFSTIVSEEIVRDLHVVRSEVVGVFLRRDSVRDSCRARLACDQMILFYSDGYISGKQSVWFWSFERARARVSDSVCLFVVVG